MSQSGDTPQPGRVDPFFAAHGYPPSTLEERAEFEVFWAQCQADWRCEIAEGLGEFAPYEVTDPVDLEPVHPTPVSPAPVSLAVGRPELIDGPTIPADLDLTEVFAAVPPENLFDEDLREEFLYTNYLADNFLPDIFLPAECTTDERHTDRADAEAAAGLRTAGSTGDDPDPSDAAAGLSPFQRHQAQFVDRVLYLEKVIAWAQASKAEVLTEAWDYT
ncbi:hypothetical protein E3T46_15250, partial [Cryobacterium sp. Hh11]|uniref:hypothetical protein n=1 Tax=Cryobacterium sp. Hh11 TaxID=2555868 RepID=UPI001102B401